MSLFSNKKGFKQGEPHGMAYNTSGPKDRRPKKRGKFKFKNRLKKILRKRLRDRAKGSPKAAHAKRKGSPYGNISDKASKNMGKTVKNKK